MLGKPCFIWTCPWFSASQASQVSFARMVTRSCVDFMFHSIPVNPSLTPIDSQIGLSCLPKAFDLRSCDGGFPIFREIHMFLGIVFQPPVKSIHLYVIRTELIHFIEFVPRFS